jgi:hypothetical protein
MNKRSSLILIYVVFGYGFNMLHNLLIYLPFHTKKYTKTTNSCMICAAFSEPVKRLVKITILEVDFIPRKRFLQYCHHCNDK